MMPMTGIVITLNEADMIAECLQSPGQVCDEIIVVDSLSTDCTREIATDTGARGIEQIYLEDGPQKAHGLPFSKNDWIFSLDAVERLEDDYTRGRTRGPRREVGRMASTVPGLTSALKGRRVLMVARQGHITEVEQVCRRRARGLGVRAVLEPDSPNLSLLEEQFVPVSTMHLHSKCSVFAVNDSRPAHLAAANGAPAVVLFGPMDPEVCAPLVQSVTVVRGDRRLLDGPAADWSVDARSMESISLAAVSQAALLLARHSGFPEDARLDLETARRCCRAPSVGGAR
jgi:hypothetical protein